MAETIFPNVVVSMPAQLFTLARAFKGAANGKVYIGKIDTDPTIPDNQIQVYLANEDGSTVPVDQPLIIGSGGYPVYGGQIAKFVTVQGHSMAVYDAYNAQQFYFPNVLKYDPDQFKNAINFISPEMFGAVGDKSHDDTTAWELLWDFVAANAGPNRTIGISVSRSYRIVRPLIGRSYSNIYGGGTLYYDGPDILTSDMLTYTGRTGFSVTNISMTRNYSVPQELWSKNANALKIFTSSDFVISDNDIFMHTDAISVTDCDRFTIQNNKTHELGEEGIAVRRSRNWMVQNNDVYHHNGDGILIKTSNAQTHDGSIINNRVYDGIGSPGTAGGNIGGGITLNDENLAGGGSSTSFHRLIVDGNHVYNLSYGIAFTNVTDISITNNRVHDIKRFGLIIDTVVFNNPNKNPIQRVIVANNSVRNTVQAGILFNGTVDILVENVTISGNVADTCGTSTSSEYPSIGAQYATVTGNLIINSKVALQADNCSVSNNRIIGSNYTSSASASAWIKISNAGSFCGNFIEDTNFGHIRLTSAHNLTISANSIKLASTYAGVHVVSVTDANTVKFSGNSYDCGLPAVVRYDIGVATISQLQLTPAESGRKSRAFDGTIPNVAAFVGDEIIKVAAGPGEARRYICTTAGTPGVYTPVEWNTITVSSSPADQTIANGATLRISANSPGMLSTSACVGAKFNQNPQGVDMTASVTEAGTVTFVLTNRTGNSKTFPGLVLSAYCHG
ncbi:phage tailspike protein [Serratia plymuthica]|uniref:phage tailspike protein n=1 Tax=Serratia plymuthica TaxID=82996 RepID=UPI002DB562B7|nr:phage tailspike protein [Serratia plymuthica]MEB6537495.1 phage tailspike protein [Serratia plymuthica]